MARGLGFATRRPAEGIRNPQSAIRNLQSVAGFSPRCVRCAPRRGAPSRGAAREDLRFQDFRPRPGGIGYNGPKDK